MNILEFIGLLVVINEIKLKLFPKKLKKKTNSYNRIDDIYDEGNFTNYQEAVICMIDICNYSRWCNDKSAIHIFNVMQEYNSLLNTYIKKQNLLEKIEIVGDCVMVVGWIYSEDMYDNAVNQSVQFATEILKNLDKIKNIFNDNNISVRIGIHRGYASCGFMNKPRKFQVFGNTVNLASRLESIADNGTCVISDITLNNISRDRQNSIEIVHKGDYELKGIEGRVSCSEIKLVK